jgi:hypothetical protein
MTKHKIARDASSPTSTQVSYRRGIPHYAHELVFCRHRPALKVIRSPAPGPQTQNYGMRKPGVVMAQGRQTRAAEDCDCASRCCHKYFNVSNQTG